MIPFSLLTIALDKKIKNCGQQVLENILGSIIRNPKEAQGETRFLLFLTSTDMQGHNVTSYDPVRRPAEQDITQVLQKPQINQLSGLTFCDDTTDPFIKPF